MEFGSSIKFKAPDEFIEHMQYVFDNDIVKYCSFGNDGYGAMAFDEMVMAEYMDMIPKDMLITNSCEIGGHFHMSYVDSTNGQKYTTAANITRLKES